MDTFESSSEPKESSTREPIGYNAEQPAAVQQQSSSAAAVLDKVQKVCYTASHWNHKRK